MIYYVREYSLVYFTSWSQYLFTFYQLWSSISITIHHMKLVIPYCKKICNEKRKIVSSTDLPSKPTGCWCGLKYNVLKWHDCIHWISFFVAGEATAGLIFLYWVFVFDPKKSIDHWEISTHILNGLLSWIDLWITQIPVRAHHIIYTIIYSVTYSIFTGFYYAAGGVNRINHKKYIYLILDYGNSPVKATCFVLAGVFIYAPLVHLFFYTNYLLREGLIHALVKRGYCKWLLEKEFGEEENEMQPIMEE